MAIEQPAADIIAQQDGLCVAGMSFNLARRADDVALRKQSARILFDGEHPADVGAWFGVPRPSGLPPYALHLSRAERDAFTKPSVRIRIFDTNRPVAVSAAALKQVFGMTDMEARVTSFIASCKSVAECASELKCSPDTVRVHLSRAFRKTRSHSQAQLVAIAVRLI